MKYILGYETIHEFNIDLPILTLIEEAHYLEKNTQGQYTGEKNRSNRSGFQSYEYFYKKYKKHSLPELTDVFDHILSLVEQNFDIRFKYSINNYWFNINYPGSFNELHNHPSADHSTNGVSGTFYLKVPTNSGNIIFQDNDEELEIESKAGKLLLFPSYLMHRVSKNNSNSERISVAFNLEGAVIKNKREVM